MSFKVNVSDDVFYLIMWGTVTLEFSSNTLVIKPLQWMLSMHYDKYTKWVYSVVIFIVNVQIWAN